jgi:hypothetical protein
MKGKVRSEEIRISKSETNPKFEFSNVRNQEATDEHDPFHDFPTVNREPANREPVAPVKRVPLYPLPTNGIFVAMMVMNWTLVSSGRLAM